MKRPDTVKEYLRGLWKLTARCNMLQRRSEYLRDKMLHSPSCSRAIWGGTRDSNLQEERLTALCDTNEEMRRCLEEMLAWRRETEGLIRGVKDFQLRAILQDRYLRHKPWEEIAGSLYLCPRYVQRLHGKALRELETPYQKLLWEKEGMESA